MAEPRTCYRCDRGIVVPKGESLCSTCKAETAASARKPPQRPVCKVCEHRFVSDWEQIKHEIHGRHNYRQSEYRAP